MVDIDYYKTVVETQHDWEIFREEMKDLIKELEEERKESIQVEAKVKVNFAEFKIAVSLLRDLADLQNGSPLVTYEKEWQRTMDNIYAFLNEHESKISA